MNQDELLEKHAVRLCDIGLILVKEEHPVEASRAGRNTVYHHCDVYQGRPSYASCLFVMDMIAEGRAQLRPECERAFQCGQCPAKDMRIAELKAGRALFYVPYEELTKLRRAKYERELENSPIQFRRRKQAAFVPTQVENIKPAQAQERAHDAIKQASHEEPDYNTDILQKVAQKVLNENSGN